MTTVPESRFARPSCWCLCTIGLVSAGAGAAAGAVAGVQSADASTGNSNDVQLGEVNSCSVMATELEQLGYRVPLGTAVTDGESGTAGVDNSPGGGHGAYGRSENGTGVKELGYGQAGVNGVDSSKDGGIGVYGTSTWGTGVKGTSVTCVGVIGTSSEALQSGVVGQGNGGAIGVSGRLGQPVRGLRPHPRGHAECRSRPRPKARPAAMG